MTYEEIVAYTKKKVAAANFKSYKGHLAAQVNITGEGEGAFYIELNDATAAVEPYEYYDRDVILVSNADVFIAILDGKKAAQDAVAAGELKLVGNVEKALELAEAFKKKAPAKKAEEKPVVAKTAEKATADTKKSAVATAKKNVAKKVTK